MAATIVPPATVSFRANKLVAFFASAVLPAAAFSAGVGSFAIPLPHATKLSATRLLHAVVSAMLSSFAWMRTRGIAQ